MIKIQVTYQQGRDFIYWTRLDVLAQRSGVSEVFNQIAEQLTDFVHKGKSNYGRSSNSQYEERDRSIQNKQRTKKTANRRSRNSNTTNKETARSRKRKK